MNLSELKIRQRRRQLLLERHDELRLERAKYAEIMRRLDADLGDVEEKLQQAEVDVRQALFGMTAPQLRTAA
jgi:hypothetical protein